MKESINENIEKRKDFCEEMDNSEQIEGNIWVDKVKDEIKERGKRKKDHSLLENFLREKRRNYKNRESVENFIYLISVQHPEWRGSKFIIRGPSSMLNEQVNKIIDDIWFILSTKKQIKNATCSDVANVIENYDKRLIVEIYDKNIDFLVTKIRVDQNKNSQ